MNECPLVTGYATEQIGKKCPLADRGCMHCMNGRCNWVELGNSENFAKVRDLSIAKFSTRSKAAIDKIKQLYMVDSYYNLLVDRHNINPQKEERLQDMEFPYDFATHYWSIELLRYALLYDNINEFRDRLTGKAWDWFNEMIEYFREIITDFDDTN